MTADAFARLVQAQRTGTGRWKARCPAHSDRLPSLSIAEGWDGRILIHCFAGCVPDAILAALNLNLHDLFQGPPPSPEQLAALQAGRKAAEQHRLAARATEREAWGKVRRLAAVVDFLGAKLVRTPDDDVPEGNALTRAFHDACERLSRAETAALELSQREAAA